MKIWFRKNYELLWLKLASYILRGRNFERSAIISRRDNNELYGMNDKVEAIIERIKSDYNQVV